MENCKCLTDGANCHKASLLRILVYKSLLSEWRIASTVGRPRQVKFSKCLSTGTFVPVQILPH